MTHNTPTSPAPLPNFDPLDDAAFVTCDDGHSPCPMAPDSPHFATPKMSGVAFERLLGMAAQLFEVPLVALALNEKNHHYFHACPDVDGAALAAAVDECSNGERVDWGAPVRDAGAAVVGDTADDTRLSERDWVRGAPQLKFYAGVPLQDANGESLGALCLLDTRPRQFEAADVELILGQLAAMAVEEIGLRSNERLYRSLIEGGSEMVTIFDVTGAVTYQSPTIKRLFGYEVNEFGRGGMYDMVHPDDQSEMSARYIHMLKYKCDIPAHRFRFRHKNGSWRTVECYTRYQMDNPQIGGIVSIARDVTDRVAIEAELSESKVRFEAAFEQSSIGIAMVSLQGRCMRANSAMAEITGYTNDELCHMDYRSLMHPDDAKTEATNIQSLLDGETKSFVLERRMRHRGGEWLWTQVSVSRVNDNEDAEKPLYFIVQVQNIDERRRQNDRLRMLESIAVNANDAILVTQAEPIEAEDNGPSIIYANEAYCRMSGYTLEEVMGKTPRIMQGPDTDPASRETIRKALKRWKPVVVELLNYHKDGSQFWVELSIVPVADERGWYTHWVSVQRDVTERKQNEAVMIRTREEAEAAREEAEAANRAKSEFLSRMSHELRTPLNAILGFGQLLEMEGQTLSDRESTEQILKAGRHLLELINEVLDISRIETGRMSVSLEPVSIAEVTRETLDLVRSMAAQYGITLDEDGIFDSPLHFVGDRRRVKQVILNLLSNAIKYNEPGGQVKLRIERVLDEDTDYERDRGRLRLCVSDNGKGIAPEKRERLWVPFDRLDAETTGVEGTGIGLALSHRLAQAMEGSLDFVSEGGNGSTFWLELPCAATPLAPSPAEALGLMPSSVNSAPTRWMALYIEDNLPNVQLVQGILARRPEVRLLTASQGALGLELAAQHCPDVILLDLHLPDINGDEVLRRLRANPETRHIPVVMISADATPGRIDRMLQAGADDYLSKPFDIGHFLGVLDDCIARGAI